MATLTFQCPKCGKTHDRIKPEMAGFKVRCQCGFVFRLGPKSAKNKQAFEEKVKEKFNSKSKSSKAAAQSNQDRILRADPIDLFGDEMLDLIPEGSIPEMMVEPPLQEQVKSPDDPIRRPIPLPDEDSEDPFVSLLPTALPFGGPSKSRKRKSPLATTPTGGMVDNLGTRSKRSKSPMAGPIWTIVLSSLGSLLMLANIRLVFIEALIRQFAALKIATSLSVVIGTAIMTITLVFAVALTIFLIVSGIVAIIELTTRTHRGWAIRWAGFVSLGMLGCLLLVFFNLSANLIYAKQLLDSNGANINDAQTYTAIVRTGFVMLFCALVPAATAITGISRNFQRSN